MAPQALVDGASGLLDGGVQWIPVSVVVGDADRAEPQVPGRPFDAGHMVCHRSDPQTPVCVAGPIVCRPSFSWSLYFRQLIYSWVLSGAGPFGCCSCGSSGDGGDGIVSLMWLRKSALELRVDAIMERLVPLRAASLAATGSAYADLQHRADTALAPAKGKSSDE